MAGIGVVTHDSSIDNLLTGTFPSPEHYLRTFSRLGKLPVENENIRKTDTLGQFFQPGVLPQAFLQFPQIINSMLQSNKLFKAYFHFNFVLNFCCILILEVLLYFDFGGFPRYQLDGYCLALLFSSRVFPGKVPAFKIISLRFNI